ncbi:MAG: diaminobutyrate acetyltransferase [Campylobacterales bacterium]|nr:diaminobutyrate acetyltransferase [Campylobacterales bacterium]
MKVDISLQKPTKNNAKHIYNLVKDTQILDINSEYLYLLQCTHFADTCIVATIDSKIIGFVSGYIKPSCNDTLFIWQVGVSKDYRGHIIASKMLLALLNREHLQGITTLETTVSPSNHASQRVFEKLSQKLNASIVQTSYFETDDFNNAHEAEILYTIKPKEKNYENI